MLARGQAKPASHGTLDPDSPLFSAIKLAPGHGQDGDLTAMEVFSLPLSARLVTLSACQTGLGKLKSGDEIIGFNRAFLAAGAGAILSSLWRVSDVATAVLMKRFYRYLRQHPPRPGPARGPGHSPPLLPPPRLLVRLRPDRHLEMMDGPVPGGRSDGLPTCDLFSRGHHMYIHDDLCPHRGPCRGRDPLQTSDAPSSSARR